MRKRRSRIEVVAESKSDVVPEAAHEVDGAAADVGPGELMDVEGMGLGSGVLEGGGHLRMLFERREADLRAASGPSPMVEEVSGVGRSPRWCHCLIILRLWLL